MKLGFYGAAHEVTGSCSLIEVGDRKGIVDFGMEQGKDIFVNVPLPVSADKLDFVLLSLHQIDNKEFWDGSYTEGKSQQEYNEHYYNELLNVMRVFKNYSVLAHLDLINRYDRAGIYPFEKVKDIVTEILRLAIADGKGIEINTSSWHYGLTDTQPSRAILKLYRELGGRIITIGSDAHMTRYLGDHIDDARSILKEIGFEEFCTFEKMKPIYHKL